MGQRNMGSVNCGEGRVMVTPPKNVRRTKKIINILPSMPNKFTSRDMSHVTGYSSNGCAVILRQLDEVENIGREPGMQLSTWRKLC